MTDPRARPVARRELAQSRSSARPVVAALLLVALTAVAYLPSLHGGFILDDDNLLTANPLIKAADGLHRIWFTSEAVDYWPLSNTSLWLEWRLWGMEPTGYHVTNLVLHIAAALLVWHLLARLSVPGAFLAALLFALHPVNVESVAWIAQRKGLLSLLFSLLSVSLFIESELRAPPRTPASATDRWYWLSLAAFVLALLSKVSAVVLPAILLAIAWSRRPPARRDLARVAPFVFAALVLLRVNLWFRTHGLQLPTRTPGVVERLLGAGAVVCFYLYKALVPLRLVFMYPDWRIDIADPRWWVPLVAVVTTTVVLWRHRRGWSRAVLYGWAYFCAALVPVMGLNDVGATQNLLVADHYQYLALIGVVAPVAAGWAAVWQRTHGASRWLWNATVVAAVGLLAVLTWEQSALYADAITLYRATLARNPDAWMAHNNLGTALLESGQRDAAMEHFEDAVRLQPDYADAQSNLGLVLLDAGRTEEARAHIERALRLAPYLAQAHYNLGRLRARGGELEDSIASLERAVRLKPDFPEAHYELATALARARRFPEAIDHFQQALRERPDYAEAHNNLGGALLETGRPQAAVDEFRQAVRLRPDFGEAHSNLGRALLKGGEREAAIEHFREAARLEPDTAAVHNDLGVALAEAAQFDEAIAHLQEALRLRPDDPDARANLDEVAAMKRKANGGT